VLLYFSEDDYKDRHGRAGAGAIPVWTKPDFPQAAFSPD